MIETAALGASAAGGVALGLFFYGGLWLTVRGLVSSSNPGRVALASFVSRSLAVVAALYAVTHGAGGAALAVALAGFVAARWALIRLITAEGDSR